MSDLSRSTHTGRPRVVVVGAGFAGLAAVKALKAAPVEVVLLDQHNHHVFNPFLYQVATALLEPVEAANPVRALVRGLRNLTFRVATVSDVHLRSQQVGTDRGVVAYDYLILAAGSVSDYFHSADIAARSFGIKDLGEALELRNQVLSRFEQASWAADPVERSRLLSFAVVGGGPTGVEFAAALAVLVEGSLAKDFPSITREEVSIVLVEGSEAPLASFAKGLQRSAARALANKGVRVESKAMVADVDVEGLLLKDGRRIEAATVVWAAGVTANPLVESLGVELGSKRRVPVTATLQLAGHPEVFVVGDLAEIPGRSKQPLPMLAQVGLQSGGHAGRAIEAMLAGRRVARFRYHNLGTMAVVGRNDGIAQIGPLHLSGFVGWLAWLFLHIARIHGLSGRFLVLVSWISGFVFADRPVRLVVGPRKAIPHASQTAGRPGGADAIELPSPSVATVDEWGPAAALAWWTQDLPGRERT
ncbi:MAG: NAD(P)/FAD-dependent oxidoreductase [Candidatus Dormibacteraeota bacterium]|uniref:NADH:ubiquinone reductase (non-electrogenic) n=1 Tax=Candidatus Aeolococcus gillhamiae TaxID=3127015 RepID=A0A934K2M9_9BACT|nr:NAD(P)/FAD-dependent oxidoreductase [Candidatus Dormibacteraeota bacterium]